MKVLLVISRPGEYRGESPGVEWADSLGLADSAIEIRHEICDTAEALEAALRENAPSALVINFDPRKAAWLNPTFLGALNVPVFSAFGAFPNGEEQLLQESIQKVAELDRERSNLRARLVDSFNLVEDIQHDLFIAAASGREAFSSGSIRVGQLLRLEGREFIEQTYVAILGRMADPAGLKHHLDVLQRGKDKVSIIRGMRFSPEGVRVGRRIRGLGIATLALLLRRAPVIGGFFGSLTRSLSYARVNRAEAELEQCLNQSNERIRSLGNEIGRRLTLLKKSLAEQSGDEAGGYVDSRPPEDATVIRTDSRLRKNRTLYYFVDHTIQCPINTGMQRLVRQLGRALGGAGEIVKFVKWDARKQGFFLVHRDEIEHLARWNGPALGDDELRSYPDAGGMPVRVEVENQPSGDWLIVPEVTHITYHPAPVTLDVIAAARRMGLRTAFVYYDAIPLRLREYQDAAEKHEAYMQQLLLVDLIIPISRWSGKELADFFAIHQESVSSRPRIEPVLLPSGMQGTVRPRTTAATGQDAGLILCVGSIEPRKNQILLLEAFERFCAAHPGTGWKLVLAGNLRGDVAETVNAAIARNGRIEHVQNISDADLDRLYRSCDFTAFPSVDEGFGLPILESVWYGKPCICANFGSMAEVAQGGGCFTVNVRDVGELQNAITELAVDRQMRGRLANEAANRQLSTWADYANEVRGLLDQEADELRSLGVIYYWVDDTCANPHNSGVQRVTRQLAQALMSLGLKLVPVKWNRAGGRFERPSDRELDQFSRWNGPHPASWAPWVTPSPALRNAWLFFPEVSHGTLGPAKARAARDGLRCAGIFYDAIPWKLRDAYPRTFAEAHRGYMGILNDFDRIYAISRCSRSDFLEFLLGDRARVTGVDQRIKTALLPGEFPDAERVTVARERNDGKVRILSVVSIEPRKNPLGLLEAFSRAKARVPSRMELVIVGRKVDAFAGLAAKVEQAIGTIGDVKWERDVDDERLRTLYAESDFTVFPSLAEGFGLPILESLWNARPCICHNRGAMAEVAEGGGCISVDASDVDALSGAIVQLATRPEQRMRLAQAATRRVATTWRDYAAGIAADMAADCDGRDASVAEVTPASSRLYAELVNVQRRPTLSICITTYNRADWLAVSLGNLEKLLPVSTEDVEIVVCDNASLDHTPEVVKPYLSRSDFRYYRNPRNVGMLGNLKVTAHHARGRYVWILGDDDLIFPGSVQKVLSAIRANPGIALIYLNYAYTREENARSVTDFDRFFAEATPIARSEADRLAPVKEVSTYNENLFTAIYCLILRRDHALRAYSQDIQGRPFSTMRTSIPTTYYVMNFMMEEQAFWIARPQVVVNFNVSWGKYASLQILERVPEALDLAERKGADPAGVDRWRENLFPGFVHYFHEMFEDDSEGNSAYFSPERLVLRMKHLEGFTRIVPELTSIYEKAYRQKHPAATRPPSVLFSAF